MITLRLYLTGETPSSRALVEHLKEALASAYPDGYELDVRSVFDNPEAAMEDEIMVTPTLLRILPEPVRRLIGDLNNEERVLAGLQVENV